MLVEISYYILESCSEIFDDAIMMNYLDMESIYSQEEMDFIDAAGSADCTIEEWIADHTRVYNDIAPSCNADCPIGLHRFGSEEEVVQLQCRHIVGKNDMQIWIKITFPNTTCPCCRISIWSNN